MLTLDSDTDLPPGRLAGLQENLMLVFTGFSRIASDVAKDKIDNLKQREIQIRRITTMVQEGIDILAGDGPLADFGKLLHEAWTSLRNQM